jgi:spore germination cell wall hydrolase CwlJ-like protein
MSAKERRLSLMAGFLGLVIAGITTTLPGAVKANDISPSGDLSLDEVHPVIAVQDEIECLALNIYFEARGESDEGKLAVAHVVMNRMADKRFPDTVCGVVRQGGETVRHRCQFSWWCDGKHDRPVNVKAWEQAIALARRVYWGYSKDLTFGALWYHADYVSPSWRHAYTQTAQIGRHIFYSDRPSNAMDVADADHL